MKSLPILGLTKRLQALNSPHIIAFAVAALLAYAAPSWA
jgi:hypothetical protein